MILKKKNDYAFGLDISDNSIKAVQLYKKGDKIKFQAIGKSLIPPGLISNGEILNRKELTKIIKKTIDKPILGKFIGKKVVLSLPDYHSFLKMVNVETSPNDLNSQLQAEIEKHIPLGFNEIYYDWQLVKKIKLNNEILVGAAPRNIVNQYLDLIDEAKLSIEAFEIEAMSISRCLLVEESPKAKKINPDNYAIIDIGENKTSFFVYSKNSVLFTVSMPISGKSITQKISSTLEIDKDQAEKAKIICGLDKDKAKGIIHKILSEMLNELSDKINHSINYFNNHFPEHGKLSKIILCGGGASIKSIDTFIHEASSVDIELGNAFNNLKDNSKEIILKISETHKLKSNFYSGARNSKTISITQDNSLSYATAIGLALRDIYLN